MVAAFIIFMVLTRAQPAPVLADAFPSILLHHSNVPNHSFLSGIYHCPELLSDLNTLSSGATSPTNKTSLTGTAIGTLESPGLSSVFTLLSPLRIQPCPFSLLRSPWPPNTVQPLVLHGPLRTLLSASSTSSSWSVYSLDERSSKVLKQVSSL